MFILPDDLRSLFKEPFGDLFPDITDALPAIAGRTILAVGDVVTGNLHRHGIIPAVAIIDGNTMRSPCEARPRIEGRRIRVRNPPGVITDELIAGIRDAIGNPPATIDVNGEEDLAVIPLVIEAPPGSAVLYGQPGEGVVVRIVDADIRRQALDLLSRFARTSGP